MSKELADNEHGRPSGHCLRVFAVDYYRALASAAKTTGLPAAAAWVLDYAILEEVTPNGVVESLGASPSSVTRQIDLLERAGLMERQGVPGDRRRWRLLPTPRGIAWHAEAVTPVFEKHKVSPPPHRRHAGHE